MARKKNNSDEGVNLDSLMDALTNVVAVLILVLILVQADVSQKVQQFLEDLQPATPEEVVASKALVKQLKEKTEDLEDKLKEEPPTPEQVEEEKRQLALLEKNVEENIELLADLEKLRELEKKIRPERDSEKAETTRIQEEIARLEAQLDETPVMHAPPPAVVTIPDSRPVPPTAEIYYAIAARDRIHLIDPFSPVELFETEFKKHRNDWKIDRIRRKGSDRIIYDQTKIAKHFENFNFRNTRNQQVTLINKPWSNRLHIEIKPDLENGGTPLAELGKKGSQFANALLALSRNRKAVLLFKVNQDSFNTYLKARNMADAVKVPAGWEVSNGPSHWVQLTEIEVNRLEDPPEKKKPPGPKPPPLKPKLD